ncbi:MAG: peptide ABC transporter substrate-binding protein, partial [Anaerolineaceae bacterium]|nr:peptide ABC transporter substrate-binding protein [Anaerolineaceae bacterium]
GPEFSYKEKVQKMNIKRIALLFAALLIALMVFSACQPAEAPEPEIVEVEKEVEVEVTRIVEGEVVTEMIVVTATPDPEAAAAEEVDEKEIIRIAYDRELDVLNPFTSQMLCDVMFAMNEGLIQADDSNQFVPILAKEIPTFDNGGIVDNGDGTYDMTWNLHNPVYWHDGEEFTSEDVCFTWEIIVGEGSEVYNSSDYQGITDCQMPDEHTVVMTWDGLYGFYSGLFEAMLPEHILGGMTSAEIVSYEPYNRGTETIGTGPYVFAEWKTGEYIRLVRNDNYWRGGDYPLADELIFMFIPDSNARYNAMLASEYDYGQISSTQVKDFDAEGMRVSMVPSLVMYHFEGNVNTPEMEFLFGDKMVRQALIHAVDREAIANDLMEGTVTVANSPVNKISPFYNDDVPKFEYDPELALSMLAEAGWTDTDGDGILDKDGVPFSFTMMNRAGYADRIAVAEVIQFYLGEIGIEVDFETLEPAAWTGRWRNREWQALVSGWFFSADTSLTNTYACDGSNNFTSFCDPELDELMHKSDGYVTVADRKPYMDQVQVLLAEDAFNMFLYHRPHIVAVNENLKNFRSSGTNLGDFWNVYEWSLD